MPTTINANLRINTAGAYKDIDVFKARLNKGFSQPLGRISGDAAEFSKSLQAAAARVTAFGATTGSIALVSKAIRETVSATIEVNKQLTELNTFLGESQSNLNNFSKSLFAIARNTGSSFADAAEAAKEFARQGLSTQETLNRTNDALVLARISGLNYAQSVNGITTALNGFSKEALTSTDIINKLIAVDTRFAVSSKDLSEALTRVGSAAEEAGLSSDQLIATITTAQQITGRGGAVIGNALKTIFTRVRRPEILDQLKQIGVVVTDQNGTLLNAIDILKNYTNVTKNLSQAEKSRTAELLGGVYQINQLQSVIRDLGSANSIYANSLRISIGATDEAIKKNAELNKSYATLITDTKNTALQVGADIGKSLFGPLITGGAGLTKSFLEFISPEAIKPQIDKTGQEIGKSLSREIAKGISDSIGNFLLSTGAPLAAIITGALGKRLLSFLNTSIKTQLKDISDPLGRYISGGSLSGNKEKEQLNLQNQISDVIRRNDFIAKSTVNGVYNEAKARREVLKEIKSQNAELQRQALLAQSVFNSISKIKPPVTDLSQVTYTATRRRDSRGRFIASGYIPNFSTADAEKEVSQAKGFGAKNPKAKLIQATIKGKTQPVMVNSEEDVIPNFAGTGDTAIIPRYRKMDDIPRMSSGYIPNFAKNDPQEFLKSYKSTRGGSKNLAEISQEGRLYSPEARSIISSLLAQPQGSKLSAAQKSKLAKAISRDIPIEPVDIENAIKNLPTKEAILKVLHMQKQKENVMKISSMTPGSLVTLRQDVPSQKEGVGVVTVRNEKENLSSYESFVRIKNPSMIPSSLDEKTSIKIGSGGAKVPTIKIKGFLHEEQSIPDLKGWTQVGFNPDRHSYYYDRNTGQPVIGGKEAVQIGNTVFVKNAKYRKKENFAFAKGYIPNFAKQRLGGGFFGEFFQLRGSLGKKKFFDPNSPITKSNVANEYVAGQELEQMIGAGALNPIFTTPKTYGSLSKSIKKSEIYKQVVSGRTGMDIAQGLDKYTGERQGFEKLLNLIASRGQFQVDMGERMKALDLVGKPENVMVNEKAESILSKISSRNYDRLFKSIESKDFEQGEGQTDRILTAIAKKGGRISILDPGIFELGPSLAKKRTKALASLGYQDKFIYANGYIPNFAKKDKYKFPNISSAKMESNIARNFEKLSPENQRYFARAYEDYNNLIKVFSKASGTSPEKFANVMSALSPANPLERNALDALRYNLFAQKKLSTIASPIFLDEREIASVKAQTYGANRTKAARLIVGLEKLTGNKRKAFLNNMLDPFGSPDVTVDYRAQGDALNKKFNVKNAPTMNREQYDKVSQAFRNVGSRAGVSGLGVQAATWVGGRMGSKAARGQDFNRGILKFFYDNPDKISLENLEFLLNVPAKGKARADFFKKASAMGVSKLGSDSLISISRAGGYIPNFAGGLKNLSSLSFLLKAGSSFSGLIKPLEIAKFFAGKGSIESVFKPLMPLMQKPTAYIRSKQDLESAKKILETLYSSDMLREKGAQFLAKIVDERNFNTREITDKAINRATSSNFGKTDYHSKESSYLKYRLFGGKKDLSEYKATIPSWAVGSTEEPRLIQNKDKTYRLNEKNEMNQQELETVYDTAKALFTGYKATPVEKLLEPRGKGGKFLGYTFKMGRYIGELGRTRRAIGYSDTWDVDLHPNEKILLDEYLTKKTSKKETNDIIAKQDYFESYAGDIDSLILRDLVSVISNPATIKGTIKIPKEKRFAKGYVPNFSGLSDAINREKTMTGLPASQIMAHFDKGGNPIAVTNKKDEPNGLKDVVPNFAPRVRAPRGSKNKKQSAQEISDLISSFFGDFVQAGIIQAAINTAASQEYIPEGVNTTAQVGIPVINALSQIVKGYKASRGQSFGRQAVAMGLPAAFGGAAAFIGYKGSQSISEDVQRKKLEKESDKAALQFKNLTEGTQELADTLSKLNEAFKDPSTSPEQLIRLNKRVSELTRNLTKNNPSLASSLSSEPNLERRINLVEDARKQASQQLAVKQTLFDFQKLQDKSPEDLVNFFSQETSLANEKILGMDKKSLVPENLKEILKQGDLSSLEAYFKKNKNIVPFFLQYIKDQADFEKVSKESSKKITSLRGKEIAARKEIEGNRARRDAASQALVAGAEELKPFAGQFGARAGISFEADLQKTKESLLTISSFRNQINATLADKDLNLPAGISKKLQGIETPGQKAGDVLSELSKSSGLNEKQKEALDKLVTANTTQSKELQKIADISEINKNAQLRILTIQEKLNYGGGAKTTLDAKSRIESINAPIKGLLENRLGRMLGSERSQTSGMVNVLKSIKDLYPGLIENSKALGSVRDRLTNLRAGDLQRDLLRNATLLQSAGGYGDIPDLLRSKAFDFQGLRNIAATQSEAELSGGGVPQENIKYLADVIKDATESLNKRMAEEVATSNLEKETVAPIAKINEETEAARQKFLNSLTESIRKTLGEKIDVQTVNIPNANVNITTSSAPNSGESSGQAQARAAMSTMASGASGPRSKGFIPSFYNPLREAIQRENQYVPFHSIRVNRSNKLINENNPLGLAVTNIIDEPNGLVSIGLASRGYIPNFALFGDKVSKTGLKAAKDGKLYVLDRAYDVYYKVSKSGKVTDKYVEADKLPKDAKIISSEISLAGTKGQNLLKLKDPKITKLDELGLSTVPKSQPLDKEIRRLKRQKQLTPENLLASIQRMSGGKDVVVKTSFGDYNVAGRGVFGTGAAPLSTSDTSEIIKRYNSKESKGFFIQNKVEGPYLAEARVHAIIDSNGVVKLVKGGTVLKDSRGGAVNFKEAGGQLSRAGYGKEGGKIAAAFRKASESTAIKTLRELAKKNPQIRNSMFAVDVGATTLESAVAAGVNTKAFDAGKSGKLGTTVFELNPSEASGSSGYATKRLGFSQSFVDAILGKQSKPGLAGRVGSGVSGLAGKIGARASDLGGRLSAGVSGLAGRVGSGVSELVGKIGSGVSDLGGRVGAKISGMTGQIGANLSGILGKITPSLSGAYKAFDKSKLKNTAGPAFSGGLAALGIAGNMQQSIEDMINGRNLESNLSFLAAISAAPTLTSSIGDIFGAKGSSKFESIIRSSKWLKAASAFGTAAESARNFRDGNYGLGSARAAEAAAYTASIFEKAGAKGIGLFGKVAPKALMKAGGLGYGVGSALGLGIDIATAENNALAEDWSDILFGKKNEYINPETGEIVKDRSYIGAGFDVFGTGLTAMSGPVGLGAAVAKIGYRAGNVIENKAGFGEKLGKFYEDKINKERAGEINAAEARLRIKKEGKKDRENFATNIARIEAETEKARKEIRSKGEKDRAELYKGIEADKEKNDKEKTSSLRKRIVDGIIKNEEINGLATSRDRANYLMGQEAIYGKFKPEDFEDQELYKSYKAYSKEKENAANRESALMTPKILTPSSPEDTQGLIRASKAFNQPSRIAAFREESARQSFELASAPKDVLEEAMRRGVSVEQIMEERRKINKSRGFIPNFSSSYYREKLDILRNPDYSGYRNAVPQPSKYYKNIVKNSAEIEVPAVEVYNRMGYFGATPKNPSEQYAILNPAQQAKLGYASGGFVPNFAAEQFAGAVSEAMQKALSPLIDKVGTSVSNSNVINVNDQRSYQTSSEQIAGIMEFLYSQFPKEMGRKMGPKLI